MNLTLYHLGMEGSKSFGIKQEGYHNPSSIMKTEEFSLRRSKVKQALMIFRNLFSKLFSEYKTDHYDNVKAKFKALNDAAMLMQRKHQWVNCQKRVGHVPGIEVGDRFQYRNELNVVGLHRQFVNGIDYVGKGKNSLATSIVVTNRYDNARNHGGSLVYSGHGWNPNVKGGSMPRDQKLAGGNLALKNSMDAKSPVRVILKVDGKSGGGIEKKTNDKFSYIYDGLYLVEKMIQERGTHGKLVFKFLLNKLEELPSTCVPPKDEVIKNVNKFGQLDIFTLRKRLKTKGCATKNDVIIMNDISNGQEKFPIRVVASTDGIKRPPSFDYIVNNIYVDSFEKPMLCGCDCVNGCVDWEKCVCIVKNGGTIPYDSKKRLASGLESRVIYECGSSCKCSSSCYNRLSQHGLQFQLEIFNSESKGWGVRTRSQDNFFSSGVLVSLSLGGEGKKFTPKFVNSLRVYEFAREFDNLERKVLKIVEKCFIDATRRGNIGRFINHSCCPNLQVMEVMYDDNDKNLPHKIFFALQDIPAGRELSFDYNICKPRVIGTGSNICQCGSPKCVGRIYI
ncbi:histone-lysine N-methyltransferase, H3 lysine-9 specific SUVH5-like [Arachis duranensis]|uniref:Histone-lysine N-methyltransferase, H3 lysine-9 specific SUVH5-like n=1 Tax=Arachis duranensis TaxID=130453 RepID=A0A6P5N6J3_ARADU|nr:histone-lysine N-methyltransferase, H3 lysine-9 specific SUVH5-like [Arachis duranensis]